MHFQGVSNKTNQSVKEPAQDAIDGGDIKPIAISVTKPVISTASSATPNVAASTPAATNTSATTGGSSSNPDVGRKKEQLMYLAQLLKFEVSIVVTMCFPYNDSCFPLFPHTHTQVMFSDFPKGNHGEYLTLVTLSTDPPQLCHGSGASLEESHDEAARGALDILSKIGLDNVKPKGSGAVTGDDSKSKK